MSFFNRANQILGMNARNLEYVSRHNSHANKKFADDKVFTKNFLSSRGIGVAKLFHVVKNHTQLTPEFIDALPEKFVLKPNQGFGGGGIYVFIKKRGRKWITPSGEKFDYDAIYRHCIEILEGKYSISGVRDTVIFEEVLVAHPSFRRLTEVGLPDVRVIVFNRVPVLAMLRVPTEESDGKANMELGAYGMGIALATGKTTGAAYHSQFLKKLPNGEPSVGFEVPFWDDILLSAARIQHMTGIGFLGCDFVVTSSGVKVLEVNARPGLKIQVANKVPLKPRLKKVADLNIVSPEDGARIAKQLFAQTVSVENTGPERMVIGAIESVILNLSTPETVLARVELNATENTISKRLSEQIKGLLDVTIGKQRLKLPVKVGDTGKEDLILAGKFLTDFLIDVNKKVDHAPEMVAADLDERKLKNLDEKVAELDEQIKLLSALNPRNLLEQKELFFAQPDYIPRFSYRPIELDLDRLRRELKRFPVLSHPLAPLFTKKIKELEGRIDLLAARETKDFSRCSEQLFGKATQPLYREAVAFLKKHSSNAPDNSPVVDAKAAVTVVSEFCKNNNLGHWVISIIEDSVADMQVTKKGKVLIRKNATFSTNRLQALLVHEIGTHVFRFENGKRQPFKLFERGTAGYLETEEGLAIYNQNQLGLDLGEKFLTPALLVVAIFLAKKMGFRALFEILQQTYSLSDDTAWKLCIKAKRGTEDQSKPGTFTKDLVYFTGERAIEKFVENGGDIEDLYIGKITIANLKVLKKFEGLVKAKFLV